MDKFIAAFELGILTNREVDLFGLGIPRSPTMLLPDGTGHWIPTADPADDTTITYWHKEGGVYVQVSKDQADSITAAFEALFAPSEVVPEEAPAGYQHAIVNPWKLELIGVDVGF